MCTCPVTMPAVRRTLVGHVHEVGPGAQLEQLGDQMGEVAVAHGAEIELAGIGLGIGNQLLHGLRREIRRHHQHLVAFGDLGDRREMLGGVVVAEPVDRRPDHQRAGIAEQERIAVGLGASDRLAAERAAGAAAVLDDHGLAENRSEPLRHQPRGGVDRPARRIRHHQLDQPVGILCAATGSAMPTAAPISTSMQRTRRRITGGLPHLLYCGLSWSQSSPLASWPTRA
jgi:hypothetical protein